GGVPDRVAEGARRGGAGRQRPAEIPAREAEHPVPVPAEDRLVETELLARIPDELRGSVRAERSLGRVTRERLHSEEHEGARGPDRCEADNEPDDEPPDHRLCEVHV